MSSNIRLYSSDILIGTVDTFLCGEYRILPDHLDPRPPAKKTKTKLQSFHRRNQFEINEEETLDKIRK
jgi:hypothetical protein